MKIYIGCFKKESTIKEEGYYSLQLGTENANFKISGYADNEGKNISKKNPLYCELTGLYWMWKNTKDKIIGLTHYRRFFYKNTFIFNKNNILKKEDAKKILKKYDLILPEKGLLFTKTVKDQYIKYHDEEDIIKCREIIEKKCNDYLQSYDKVFNSNSYHPLNMFIGKKEIIDDYCGWLFPILNELEMMIDVKSKKDNDKRFCGFIAERLFNVYILKNNIKYTTLPVYNVEKSFLIQGTIHFIKKIILNIYKIKK